MKWFLRKFANKFSYAIKGIWITIREEKSIWVHFLASAIVIGLGVWLDLSLIQWSIVSLAIGLVIGFEVFNSAIEALVDMISFQYNLKVKKIKDISAGATFFVTIIAIIVGCLIFIPKIIDLNI